MQSEIRVIAAALIEYVLANRFACDTEEGIERWWLSDRAQRTQDVNAALDWLVHRGLWQTTTAADGRTSYRRNAADEVLQAALDEFRRGNQPKEYV
jgi:hypothetical protein